ncbi:MAG: putative uridylate kinase [halophilic archaeon J07HX64]|jgi:uridylate kinase, putative|nr:MAG: putative uridylate kinase [halophilic archaeon J07HX64]
MRVVVSVGGSVLVPELEAERVEAYAETLLDLVESGHELGVVVGGGPVAREYIGTARALGADEISLDRLGIEVTRLNARLLAGALGDAAVSRPVEAVESARELFRRGDIPVLGGTTPGHTTDAVATGVAEHAGADLLVYATSVDGVFDADPGVDDDAAKLDRLSPTELVEVVGEVELDAGSNAPVDLLAAKLLQRSDLRAVVVDGSDPERVAAAVDGEHDGTDIVPEG